MKYLFIVFIFLWGASTLSAQLPKTELLWFNYTTIKKGKIQTSNPKLLSQDNASGYNNQPAFINNEIYISQSYIRGGQEQTDIVALDLKQNTKSIVTQTKASEYSPTVHPDGKNFTIIKAAENGHQNLVKYPLDRQSKGETLFPNITNIGYHCWLSQNKVALFLVNESKGHKIVIGDITTGKTKHVAFNVGRCMKVSKNGNLIYLDKEINDSWRLKTLLVETGQSILLGEVLSGEEDFELLPDGHIIMGHQGVIYKLIPEKGSEWIAVCDLKKYVGPKKITRIAADDDEFIIVIE